MARTLKLDILVDDHGGTRTLRGVADAERDVAREAGHAGTAMGALGTFVSQAAASFTAFVAADVVLRGLRATVEFATRAAFGMNAELETSTLQFETLMGSSSRAEAHVKSLFEFAKRTPFETGPIIEASRILQVMGGDALNTTSTLKLLGDSAAATAAPLDELARWTGRLYAALQGGQPIGEATRRLMELGVLSPQAVESLRQLSEGGGHASEAFKLFTEELGRHEGAMARQASTWQGLISTFVDGAQIAIAEAFEPLFNAVKNGLSAINQVMESPAFEQAAERVHQAMLRAFSPENIQAFAESLLNGAKLVLQGLDFIQTGFNAFQAGIAQVFLTLSNLVGTWAETMISIIGKIPGAMIVFRDQLIMLGAVLSGTQHISEGFTSVLREQEEDYRRNANAIEGLLSGLELIRSALPSVTAEMSRETSEIDSQTGAIQRLTLAQLNFAEVAMPKSLQATHDFMSMIVNAAQAMGIGFNPSDYIVGGVPFNVPGGETTGGPKAAAGAPSWMGGGGGGGGWGGGMGGGGGQQSPYFLPDYSKPVYGAGGLLGYQSQTTPAGGTTTIEITVDAKGAVFESEAVFQRLADKVADKMATRYGQGVRI